VEVEPEMKTQRLAAVLGMTAMAAASLCAGQSAVTQRATVIVCMESDTHALEGVRPLTAAMFARIGVRIAWHALDACPVGVDAIQVQLSRGATSVRNAGYEALAVAQPYARTVTVFLDRVKELNRNRGMSVMAVVLAHEITHVLEGTRRHSSTGIMKARWDDHDNLEIGRQTLAFAQDDIDLIYAGLKTPRATEAAVAAQ
jgi:hypothetical protein